MTLMTDDLLPALPARNRFRVPRCVAATLASVLILQSCSPLDVVRNIQELPSGALELAPVETCEEARQGDGGMVGVHLRQSDVDQQFEMLSLTGNIRVERLPRTLDIDEVRSRLITTDIEELKGTRRSTALPRSFFSDGESLPAVYDLSYSADDVNFAGPLVVGYSAPGADLPTTGRALFRGPVQLSRSFTSEDGSTSISTADAEFAVVVGYGSNTATFTLSGVTTTSGEAMPFVSLEWRNLGLCGTRVLSTGQGTVRLLSEDGRRVSPFTDGRSLPALLSSFEALHFNAAPPPSPPGDFGGIFSIESDIGTLAAVFLSQSSP